MRKFSQIVLQLVALTVLVAALYGLHPLAGAIAGVIGLGLVLVWMVPFGGLTLAQRRALRKYRASNPRENRYVFTALGSAASWDGESFSMFLELSPSPLQTVAFTDDGAGLDSVPLAILGQTMRQHGITVDDIYCTSFGYVTDSKTAYERAYASLLKGAASSWTTIIEVSLRLERSLEEIAIRKGGHLTAEEPLATAVSVATQRLMRELIAAGWRARILDQHQIEAYDQAWSARVGDLFDHEHATMMGADTTWSAAYAATDPDIAFNALAPEVTSLGVCHHLQLRDQGYELASYVLLCGDTPASVQPATKQLRKLKGVQGDVTSYFLPLAPNPMVFAPHPTKRVADPATVVPATPAWGVGAILGQATGTVPYNVGWTMASGAGEVAYIAGHPTLVKSILTRLMAAGNTIHIEHGEFQDWAVNVVRDPRMTTSKLQRASIVVVGAAAGVTVPARAHVLTICVTSEIPSGARYSIEQRSDGVVRVISGMTYRDLKWTASSSEMTWWQ